MWPTRRTVILAIKSMIALNVLGANGAEPPITVRTTEPMDGTAVAGKARAFVVQIARH